MEWSLIREQSKYSQDELRTLNPISIAYMGDCIYELYMRNYVMRKFGNINSNKLHFEVIKYVNAKSQKDAYFKVKDLLTEEEQLYFRKGRNSKIKTVPKNATISDYRVATGFEAVIGYLYITRNFNRLDFILSNILDVL